MQQRLSLNMTELRQMQQDNQDQQTRRKHCLQLDLATLKLILRKTKLGNLDNYSIRKVHDRTCYA